VLSPAFLRIWRKCSLHVCVEMRFVPQGFW